MAVKNFKVAENQLMWDTFVSIKLSEDAKQSSINQYKPTLLAFDEHFNKSIKEASVSELVELMEIRNGKGQVHLNGFLLTCINNDMIEVSQELAIHLVPENYKIMLGKVFNIDVERKESEIKRAESYEYEGKIYTKLSELSEAVGVSYNKLKHRLDKGMTLSEAIEFNDKSIEYDGVIYRNEAELARAYGIEPMTYYSRKKEGKTLHEILTKPVGKYERRA